MLLHFYQSKWPVPIFTVVVVHQVPYLSQSKILHSVVNILLAATYNLWLFEWGNLYQVYYKHRHYGCVEGHSATEQVYLDAYDAWLRETSRLIEVYKRQAGS